MTLVDISNSGERRATVTGRQQGASHTLWLGRAQGRCPLGGVRGTDNIPALHDTTSDIAGDHGISLFRELPQLEAWLDERCDYETLACTRTWFNSASPRFATARPTPGAEALQARRQMSCKVDVQQ